MKRETDKRKKEQNGEVRGTGGKKGRPVREKVNISAIDCC